MKDLDAARVKSATLLGAAIPLHVQAVKGGVTIEFPAVPAGLMTQPAWVVKLAQ